MLVVTRAMAAFPCGSARAPEPGAARIDPLHQVFHLADAARSQTKIPRRFQPRLAAGFDEAADATEAPAGGDTVGLLGDWPLTAVIVVLALIGVAAAVIAVVG